MGKRVAEGDVVDPVRSRLAASAAAAARPSVQSVPTLVPSPEEQGREEPRRTPSRGKAKAAVARDRLTVNRKVMFTEDEAERNSEVTELIAAAFGNPATYSQITRAMWSILGEVEDAIKANGKRTRRLAVPSKGDHVGMAEYEASLAEFLSAALRR